MFNEHQEEIWQKARALATKQDQYDRVHEAAEHPDKAKEFFGPLYAEMFPKGITTYVADRFSPPPKPIVPPEVQAIAEKVAKTMGVPTPPIEADWLTPPVVMGSRKQKEGGVPAIFFNPFVMEFLPPDDMEGIIAHEMAHIVLGHLSVTVQPPPEREREQEAEADAYAAKFGFGRQLANGLATVGELLSAKDATHPDPAGRVLRLLDKAA